MENIIWTNDTGQIDAIIEDWSRMPSSRRRHGRKPEGNGRRNGIRHRAHPRKGVGGRRGRIRDPDPAAPLGRHQEHRRLRHENPRRSGRPQCGIPHGRAHELSASASTIPSSSSARPDSGTAREPSPASWLSTTSGTSSPTAHGTAWNTRRGASTSTTTCVTAASTTTGSTPAPSANSKTPLARTGPSDRTTCGDCSGQAVPSARESARYTACPRPRKNAGTAERKPRISQ